MIKPRTNTLAFESSFFSEVPIKKKGKVIFKPNVIYSIAGFGYTKPNDSGIRSEFWVIIERDHPKSDVNKLGCHLEIRKEIIEKLCKNKNIKEVT